MKKILFVTGTRAEYNLLKPIIDKVIKSKKIEYSLVVTGMHLLPQYGNTYKLIQNEGIKIDAKLKIKVRKKGSEKMSLELGKMILGLSTIIKKINPNITVVLGDRTEALAATCASAYQNIPVAHIHAGDKADSLMIDESTRQAITSMSHLYFCASKNSAKRLNKMGLENWRIHNVGAPGLDNIKNKKYTNTKEIKKKLNLKEEEKFVLIVFHPIPADLKNSIKGIKNIIKAVKKLKIKAIAIYPNSDFGTEEIIYHLKKSNITSFNNLSNKDYLGLLNNAEALIGNSSSGIIEAPSFHLPVVNIGERNKHREQAKNIILVDYEFNNILKGINKAINHKFKKSLQKLVNPYGNGTASKKIVKILEQCLKKDKEELLLKKGE